MSEKLTYSVTVQAAGGPRIALSESVDVEAYDKIAVTIGAGDTTEVNVQPAGTGLGSFLLVQASDYGTPLTYTANADPTVYTLDGPHVLIGPGAVAMVNTDLESLTFTSTSGEDIDVEILAARDATP